ncbi:MAG: Fic family protein [Thermoproteota archaeon]|nr:Fic family protein [Thermoproteota archaeon]
MVSIKKKKSTKGNIYYYLQHTVRKGRTVKYKEIYLGKKIPKDIDELKIKLFRESYKELYDSIQLIKKNSQKEIKTMPKSMREKSIELFVTRFTYDTQRIEGSTLSLRDTSNLLERGITPKNKPIEDIKEAEAHKKLFYKILMYQKEKDLSYNTILGWHQFLFRETKPEIAGRIRKHKVGISGSKFVPPLGVEVYPQLKDFFKWYTKNTKRLHPVELAALAHLKFVTIHPFGDGNGRISRLMMNFVLNKKEYPMFNISYEKRTSYYNALERSQIKKEWNHFLLWFIKKYIASNKT